MQLLKFSHSKARKEKIFFPPTYVMGLLAHKFNFTIIKMDRTSSKDTVNIYINKEIPPEKMPPYLTSHGKLILYMCR